jgi:hypothetical protein
MRYIRTVFPSQLVRLPPAAVAMDPPSGKLPVAVAMPAPCAREDCKQSHETTRRLQTSIAAARVDAVSMKAWNAKLVEDFHKGRELMDTKNAELEKKNEELEKWKEQGHAWMNHQDVKINQGTLWMNHQDEQIAALKEQIADLEAFKEQAIGCIADLI